MADIFNPPLCGYMSTITLMSLHAYILTLLKGGSQTELRRNYIFIARYFNGEKWNLESPVTTFSLA